MNCHLHPFFKRMGCPVAIPDPLLTQIIHNMKTPNHVMVLDHDPNTAKLCETLFESMEGYSLIAQPTSLREAMVFEERFPLDLLIMETKINAHSGLRYANGILERKPEIKILIVSKENDFELIKQAFKIGVHGYLTKPVTLERMLSALHTIAEEGTPLSNDVSKKIIAVFREKRYDMLSQRENQIIGYLGEGATYKDIAKKLFVTPSTVNFHLQNIYLKLDVKSKSEALQKIRTYT